MLFVRVDVLWYAGHMYVVYKWLPFCWSLNDFTEPMPLCISMAYIAHRVNGRPYLGGINLQNWHDPRFFSLRGIHAIVPVAIFLGLCLFIQSNGRLLRAYITSGNEIATCSNTNVCHVVTEIFCIREWLDIFAVDVTVSACNFHYVDLLKAGNQQDLFNESVHIKMQWRSQIRYVMKHATRCYPFGARLANYLLCNINFTTHGCHQHVWWPRSLT